MSNLLPVETQPSQTVKELLLSHQEALIVFLDPDVDTEGESKITCFLKLNEKSRLAAYLEKLLQQLLKTSSAKPCRSVSAQTTTGP